MLQRLQTHDVGPAKEMTLDFGERLNVLTGDNGLGKSFVLEFVWWLLTGSWAGPLAVPSGQAPKVHYEAQCDSTHKEGTAHFDFGEQRWRWDSVRAGGPMGSVVYLGAHRPASFVLGRSVFPPSFPTPGEARLDDSSGFRFQGRELWDGKLDEAGRPVCNGLIRDVVNWMRSRPIAGFDPPDGQHPHPFEVFEAVLETLSPPDGDALLLGPPRRVFVDDSRDIPTLWTPWESEPVPVNLAAAGMRRILELTYLLVWTWYEQLQVAHIKRLAPSKRLFILVDEPETHLHPRWQRSILPALVEVAKKLDGDMQVQLFVTTHSPLVLASGETLVDERDRLFHFDARDGVVKVDEMAWVKQGDAVGWLTSEIFGFTRGGSREGEQAVRWAEAFMDGDLDAVPAQLRDKHALDAELRRALAASDPFWVRWFVQNQDVGT